MQSHLRHQDTGLQSYASRLPPNSPLFRILESFGVSDPEREAIQWVERLSDVAGDAVLRRAIDEWEDLVAAKPK